MLLTYLHETITRRAKTTEELQKLIDVSGSTGIEAASSDSVNVKDRDVVLQNLITAGSLPFKFEASDYDVRLYVMVPTLRSLHGMEALEIGELEVGSVSTTKKIVTSKLTTLKGMPKVSRKVKLKNLPELKSLEGLNVDDGFELSLYKCPQIQNLELARGARKIQLYDCENLTFQHFPESCEHLDLEYFTITRGLPWYITIPYACKIKHSSVPFGLTLPPEILKKLIEYQQNGKNSKVDLLEIQTDLIDADLDHLAEL